MEFYSFVQLWTRLHAVVLSCLVFACVRKPCRKLLQGTGGLQLLSGHAPLFTSQPFPVDALRGRDFWEKTKIDIHGLERARLAA